MSSGSSRTDVVADDVLEALADVEDQMRSLMTRIRDDMKRAAIGIHAELSPFGYRVLCALLKSGPLGPGALASSFGVDKSFMSRQIRQLEGWSLVEVGADSADGRARVVNLTATAQERLSALSTSGRTALQEKLQTWSADDLRQFARYLGMVDISAD